MTATNLPGSDAPETIVNVYPLVVPLAETKLRAVTPWHGLMLAAIALQPTNSQSALPAQSIGPLKKSATEEEPAARHSSKGFRAGICILRATTHSNAF